MPISEWWVKSQLTRLINNVSTSSSQTSKWCASEFDSHATTKYNNMSKIRDNYLAEIIVLIVIATMLLTSCGSTKKCCIKTANEVYKYEGMYANQEWDEE